MIRAVVFDLWETLVDWDRESGDEHAAGGRRALRSRAGRVPPPLGRARTTLGTSARSATRCAASGSRRMRSRTSARCASTTPAARSSRAPGVVETLRTLRERGFRVGLITVCSEDVEVVFPETELAGLFDAEVFSNAVRLAKPDPRIYLHCCELLGVEPHEAVFVGDGANDELEGARRVGMEAILIHRPGEEPPWPGLEDWDGPRVTSIPAVLDALPQAR